MTAGKGGLPAGGWLPALQASVPQAPSGAARAGVVFGGEEPLSSPPPLLSQVISSSLGEPLLGPSSSSGCCCFVEARSGDSHRLPKLKDGDGTPLSSLARPFSAPGRSVEIDNLAPAAAPTPNSPTPEDGDSAAPEAAAAAAGVTESTLKIDTEEPLLRSTRERSVFGERWPRGERDRDLAHLPLRPLPSGDGPPVCGRARQGGEDGAGAGSSGRTQAPIACGSIAAIRGHRRRKV